jgi:hypothetical protein
MRNRLLVLLGAGLVSLLGAGRVAAVQTPDLQILGDQPKPKCGKYGTTVTFVSSPSEAARKAKAEEKLVFVLHVSGHFEDPKFT